MPVSFQSRGNRRTYLSVPSATTLTTIFTVSGAVSVTLDGLNVAVTGAGNVSVFISDGVTNYPLLSVVAFLANTQASYTFGNPVLLSGWSIKVQVSNADDVCFALTMAAELRGDQSSA